MVLELSQTQKCMSVLFNIYINELLSTALNISSNEMDYLHALYYPCLTILRKLHAYVILGPMASPFSLSEPTQAAAGFSRIVSTAVADLASAYVVKDPLATLELEFFSRSSISRITSLTSLPYWDAYRCSLTKAFPSGWAIFAPSFGSVTGGIRLLSTRKVHGTEAQTCDR